MCTILTAQHMESRLIEIGWQTRCEDYSRRLAHAATTSPDLHPDMSVIVVAHAPTQYSLEAFLALKAQVDESTELVFVDNNSQGRWGKLMAASATTVVRLNVNAGAYCSRNMGSIFAQGRILIFVDDDAMVAPDFLRAYRELFAHYHPLCARGRVEPLTDALPNTLAQHYDLGSKVIPRYPDLEGNMAVDAQAFFRIGGWDDQLLYGHGGMDLSFRLLQIDSDRGRQLYSPAPVIRHDYAADTHTLQKKREKQQQAWIYLCAKHTGFEHYAIEWENWYMRGGQPALPPPSSNAQGSVSETPKHAPCVASSVRPKTIYLHIGLPKTGTTAIQSTLESMQETLAQQDYAYVTCGQCFNWLLMLLEAREKSTNANDTIATLIRSHIENLPQQHIIMSCENFSGYFFYEKNLLTQEIANVLHIALQDHSVRVLIYLRRQDLFFESIYTQTLHIGRDWSFEQYTAHSSPALLHWKTILDTYSGVFGKEALEIRIYERPRLLDNDVVSDFLQWVQVSPSHKKNIVPFANMSLSPASARIARVFNTTITLREEESDVYLSALAAAQAEGTKTKLEYLHCRQACRHGIHPERFASMYVGQLQSLLNTAGSGCHGGSIGYMDPEQRTTFLTQFATENADIAKEYLYREDGYLFDNQIPKTTVRIDTPSYEDIIKVILPALLKMHAQLEQLETLIANQNERLNVFANMAQWLVSRSRYQSNKISAQQENLVEATELLNKIVDTIAHQ